MASQGPLSPGTIANSAGGLEGGTTTNPNNIKVSDNAYATGFDTQLSYTAANYGFSIPTGSTIDGILVEVEKKKSNDGSGCIDVYARIKKSDGSVGSTDKALGSWPNTDTYVSYGSSSDLWGETWTAEDINDADFGFFHRFRPFEETAYVDHCRITVYYTAGGGGGSVNSNFFGLM